jgi:hypothetical protein
LEMFNEFCETKNFAYEFDQVWGWSTFVSEMTCI